MENNSKGRNIIAFFTYYDKDTKEFLRGQIAHQNYDGTIESFKQYSTYKDFMKDARIEANKLYLKDNDFVSAEECANGN